MRNRFILMVVFAALSLGQGTGSAATDEVLAKTDGDLVGRIHFAGTTRITASSSKLNELAALPETTSLRDQTLQKLATTPFRLFQQKIAKGVTNDFAELIRPLLDDLLHEESYTEMRGPTNAMPETMVAVHLNSNRAQIWRDNLSKVLSTWTGIPVKQIKGDGFAGWELKKHHDPNLIRCLRVGDWVVFGWGQDELRLQPAFLQRIKTQKRPVEAFKEDWLEALVDWPTLMKFHPFTPPGFLPARLPKMHLTVQTRKDFVRPKLVMQFAEPLNLNLEPWKIPTNFIRNPLVSFTAVRGVAPWLSQLEVVKKSQPPTVPNQLAFWSIAKMPFDTGVAAPVPNASNYLAQLAPRLVPALASFLTERSMPSNVQWTNNFLLLGGMPFVMPNLSAVHEPAGDFLRGGLLPPMRRTNAPPFPPELLHELLSKPNLVSYSWEKNEERAMQWLGLHQIYLMDTRKGLPPSSATGVKWLQAAAKAKLGCTTEITLTAPNELTLLRNGTVGLSGMEMIMLEYWIDAPGFPLEANYPRKTLGSLKKNGAK